MNRKQKITEAAQSDFELIVVGGGIHGACVARDAALRGYRVLLLEANDYAFGTSSRSSKLLHGGLRYLENADFKLVFEALSERKIVRKIAPHLTKAEELMFPILPKLSRPGWQVKLGLSLYDILSSGFSFFGNEESEFRNHRKLDLSHEYASTLNDLGLNFSALYSYFDGQMDDARLVVENVVDAAKHGALTINYAKVNKINRENGFSVEWSDELTNQIFRSQTKYLINTAGPWMPLLHQNSFSWDESWPTPIYSRGTHLIFNCPWSLPGLFLPTNEQGRNYWVLPYFSSAGAATLVGTTDVKLKENEEDPQATEEEINELLGFLKRDFPNSELSEQTLAKSFAGMRILAGPPGASTKSVSKVSRGEYFIDEGDYLSFLGGKFTTSRLTAERILDRVDKFYKRKTTTETRELPLPGGEKFEKSKVVGSFMEFQRGDDPDYSNQVNLLVQRFGSKSEVVFEIFNKLEENKPIDRLNRAQITYAIKYEQAVCADDVLRRRLGTSLIPEPTFSNIETFCQIELGKPLKTQTL